MTKLLIGSLMALSLVVLTGCNDTATAKSSDSKTMKCGEGKCGSEKKAEGMKCGADKKATESNVSKCGADKKATESNVSKCGEGKCGGDKK